MILKIKFTDSADSNLSWDHFGKIFECGPEMRPHKGETLVALDESTFLVEDITLSNCTNSNGEETVMFEYLLKRLTSAPVKKISVGTQTRLVMGFPGVGKTYFNESMKLRNVSVSDSDFSLFSKSSAFPSNYIRHIKNIWGVVDFILTSTHKKVREAIAADPFFKDKKVYIVYPDKSLKAEYIERYRDRGNNQEFVTGVATHWDEWIDEIEAEPECFTKICLKEGENLADFVKTLVK